jgi:hypothetical protein
MSEQLQVPAASPQQKETWYTLGTSLNGPYSLSRPFEEETKLVLAGNRTLAFQPVSHRFTGWAINVPHFNIILNICLCLQAIYFPQIFLLLKILPYVLDRPPNSFCPYLF